MTIVYDPYGRQGIGVVQPYSGLDYPLARPSADIRELVADFFLSYEDPSTFDEGDEYVRPFHIKWLYGVGETVDAAPGWAPTPTHDVDILIVDDDGTTVFDSTEATTFRDFAWGSTYHVYQWNDATQVCRIVVHTAWPPTGDITPHEYDQHLVPDNGELDERTLARLPKRVRSISVVLDEFTEEENIDFTCGNNIDIETAATTLTQGKRRDTRITFNVRPGAGTGKYSNCEETLGYVARINGVAPDVHGNLSLAATGCYYFRQPTTIVSTSPRRAVPSILLNPLAGHLKVGNDCGPCCTCDDMIASALWMNRLRDDYASIAALVSATRDQYHANRERWLLAAACREVRPLSISMLAQNGPYIDIVGQFCNQTSECLGDLELIFDFSAVPTATGVEVVCGSTRIWETSPPAVTPYTLGGDWPTFSAYWDSVQAFSSAKVQFRLKFPGLGLSGDVPYAVTAGLTAKIAGEYVLDPDENPVTTSGSAALNAIDDSC